MNQCSKKVVTWKNRLILVIIINVSILVACTILLLTRLNNMWDVPCVINMTTGLSCPGCGMTRLVLSLVHGKVYQAFRYNIFFFITLPMLFVLYIYQTYLYVKEQRLSSWLDSTLLTYAVLEVAWGFIRNIEMFSWMLPTEI
jgi:hypothetical protein